MYDSSLISRTRVYLATAAILLGVVVGCGKPKAGGGADTSTVGGTHGDTTAGASNSNATPAGDSTTGDQLPCRLVAGFPSTMDSITTGYRSWIKGDDNCVGELIDTLCATYIHNGDKGAIGALDSVARIADGYVSELLSDQSVRLLHESPGPYLGYLVGLGDSSAMRQQLVMGIRSAVEDSAASGKAVKAIEASIAGKSPALDKKSRAFLDGCLKQSEPSLK